MHTEQRLRPENKSDMYVIDNCMDRGKGMDRAKARDRNIDTLTKTKEEEKAETQAEIK